MQDRSESDSRKLLRRLRDVLAIPAKGQDRLDRITHLIADSMGTEVCSIYLFRDAETLELCATEGLKQGRRPQDPDEAGRRAGGPGRPHRPAGQHRRCALRKRASASCPKPAKRLFSSFLGVPIQRVGEKLGVLVVQSKDRPRRIPKMRSTPSKSSPWCWPR